MLFETSLHKALLKPSNLQLHYTSTTKHYETISKWNLHIHTPTPNHTLQHYRLKHVPRETLAR